MSYLCGLGGGLPGGPRDPALYCDGEGCTAQRTVVMRGRVGIPAAWFMNRKAAPGWKLLNPKDKDSPRRDLCGQCASRAKEDRDAE